MMTKVTMIAGRAGEVTDDVDNQCKINEKKCLARKASGAAVVSSGSGLRLAVWII